MKKSLLYLLLFLSFSCSKIGMSETQQQGIDKVLEFYGGICHRSLVSKNENGIKTSYFQLDISNSELLNKYSEDLEPHAGNIAYLFYSNLNDDEKKSYNEIRVIIILDDDKKVGYQFPVNELKEIEILKTKVNKINSYIQNQDFKSLTKEYSSKFKITESDFREKFNDLNARFGNVLRVQFQGFTFKTGKEMGDIIIFRELLVMDKDENVILMELIYERKTNELIGINFS